MVMLVVMVTTLTTAQEAFRQYDGLKAQARDWATLRLLTGFINAYTPQDDSPDSQGVTCSVNQTPSESSLAHDAPAQDAGFREAQIIVKRDTSNHVARVALLTPEAEHHSDSLEASEIESEHAGEVAMLAETVEALPEDMDDDVEETTEQHNSSDDNAEEGATVHRLREVRRIDRTLNRDLTVTAPTASDTASLDAALHKARVASRTDAQMKVKALKRALKVIQIQLEKAAKVELRTGRGNSRIEQAGEISTSLQTPESTGSMTARYTLAPQGQITVRAQASLSTSECAAE
jgi:hypothetical protein